MGFNSNLHNMKSLDDIIEDVNKNIKKVFLAGVAPEFWQEAYIISLKLTLDKLAQEVEFTQKDNYSSEPVSSEQWSLALEDFLLGHKHQVSYFFFVIIN